MLKKEISDSKKLGRLPSDRPRVLYFMMLPHLDVKGRLYADPQKIKGQIVTMLPYSPAAIQKALEQLHEVGLIVLYQINGDQYLEYTRFSDFQRINADREAESKISGPTPDNSGVIQRTPLKLSKDKLSLSKDKEMSIFDESRKLFKGTKRGLQTEFDNFRKHEDWEDVLPLLKPAVVNQIAWRVEDGRYWKNFKTWINQRCWEETQGVSCVVLPKLFPISGKTCSYEGCTLPAVYKDTSGSYDHYKCNEHLPDEVKKLYG